MVGEVSPHVPGGGILKVFLMDLPAYIRLFLEGIIYTQGVKIAFFKHQFFLLNSKDSPNSQL